MDHVGLVAYDPAWPGLYAAEAARLLALLPPGLVLAAEHFGSTAIPSLAARPVIDILLAVRSVEEARRVAVAPMAKPGSEPWVRLLFRDHLRAHPEEEARYAALEQDLAARHRDDREAYTAGEAEYVEEVMAKARSIGRSG